MYNCLEEDICYVCLEQCKINSPCKCEAPIHDKCLKDVKEHHGRICTICKSRYPSSESSESSKSSESSETSEYEECNTQSKQVLCYLLIIVGFLIYIILNFIIPY